MDEYFLVLLSLIFGMNKYKKKEEYVTRPPPKTILLNELFCNIIIKKFYINKRDLQIGNIT
jgi:hypothetical protein